MVGQPYKTRSGRSIEASVQMLGDRVLRALAAEVYREGTNIIAASQPLVPVATGTLRGTAYVTIPDIQGNKVTVHIGYGGPSAPYALYVHENMMAHHPVGQAKYLEQPFNEALPGMPDRLKSGVVRRVIFQFQYTNPGIDIGSEQLGLDLQTGISQMQGALVERQTIAKEASDYKALSGGTYMNYLASKGMRPK